MYRGGGRGNSRARGGFQPSTEPAISKNFASTKNDHMPTARSMVQKKDDKVRQAEDVEFLGHPPPDRDLIQVSLTTKAKLQVSSESNKIIKVTHVLPGKELIPQGLDHPGALDDIRRKYRVYITRDKPNVLDIRCESMSRLQQALQAINWVIRDMRLSNEGDVTLFLAQTPTNAILSDMIRAKLGARPYFVSPSLNSASNTSALDDHLHQLGMSMASSVERLTGFNKTMGFRVNFGRLIIGKRKKGHDEITYSDLTKLMDAYSNRGGATFEHRLKDVEKAEQLLQFLVRPEVMVCNGPDDIKRGCEVIVATQGQEIKAEADYTSDQGTQLAMVRATKPESSAPLSWTIAAPDMQYDWNFRVDAWDQVDIPPEFKDLAKKVVLIVKPDEGILLPVPSMTTTKLASLDGQITHIKARSWAIVPFKETDYVLKISITKTLKGVRAEGEPDITWGLELYAPHWDESVNHASGGRKDWGKGLENIWTEGHDLKSRLEGFIGTVLEVQALLNRVHTDAASP
ncbi:hypothetical protein FSARC_3588 [Fusarium sarcochroum]|uniref:Uncharacterized protein n=1 Tax=Fusarium sarcochroum TaxID=1208366 RepID=A0A8H4XCF9_9HYPO|nr:hypothetical protein FSARC_3588 [Fusarium sarcochroum]